MINVHDDYKTQNTDLKGDCRIITRTGNRRILFRRRMLGEDAKMIRRLWRGFQLNTDFHPVQSEGTQNFDLMFRVRKFSSTYKNLFVLGPHEFER